MQIALQRWTQKKLCNPETLPSNDFKSANSRFRECFSRVHEILEHRVIKVKYRTADSGASTSENVLFMIDRTLE